MSPNSHAVRVLVVAATPPELDLIRAKAAALAQAGVHVHCLPTGIGMVNTAFHMGQLSGQDFDLAVNVGIAGAFPGRADLKEVVHVVADSFAELGADAPAGFIDLESLGFPSLPARGDQVPRYNTFPSPGQYNFNLRQVLGITVNRVSGTADGIARRQQLWDPGVESMEGAAFFQTCHLMELPGFQFRAISNRVEPRDRSQWDIPGAVQAVQQWLLDVFLDPLLLQQVIDNQK